MDEEITIVYMDDPEKTICGIIGGAIRDYNQEQQIGDQNLQRLCFVLRTSDQTIVGGVIGVTYWDWLFIDLLWVKDEFRGRGYGHRLLMFAENEARQRGAMNSYLDTFSFQAPDFYQQHGYRIFGELQNFPTGHQRYFLTKKL